MHLGPGASVSTIFRKLDKIYGTMDEKEDIFSEFYSARQKKRMKDVLIGVVDWKIS